jgi:predicted porin
MTRTRLVSALLASVLAVAPFPVLAQSVREQLAALAAQNAELAKRIAELEAQVAATSAKADETAAKVDEVPNMQTLVTSNTGRNRLEVYGQVNRAVLGADNGNDSDVFFVDNSHSSSRFGLRAEHRTEGSTVIGGQFEFEPQQSPSGGSQGPQFDSSAGSAQFRDRIVQVYVTDPTWGRFFLGQGSVATDDVNDADLSGAGLITGPAPDDFAGSLDLGRSNGSSANVVRVRDVFTNLDTGRENRFRYDTPEFFGARLSGSASNTGRTDFALRWAGDLAEGFRAEARAGVRFPGDEEGSRGFDQQYGVSATMRYVGFSVSGAYSVQEGADADSDGRSRDPSMYRIGLGYQNTFFDVGRTSFGLDYFNGEDARFSGDDAESIGFGVVQGFDRQGVEAYLGGRWYGFDRRDGAGRVADNSFEDMIAVMSGARVRF